jgi:transposase
LLPHVPGLLLERLIDLKPNLLLLLSATNPIAFCPHCQTASSRVHSYYNRRIKDLPWADFSLRLYLRVRRFYCHNSQCPKVTFAERLGDEIKAYARRTTRLDHKLQKIALVLGGEAGAALARTDLIDVSPDTLLRLLQKVELPAIETPKVLGVDDFAWRKGQRYGTILLNLETHQPIDLLADREVTTFANWLSQHPGIEIISRDRSSAYAEAAKLAAPQAVQVADIFHIYQNLGETLERIVKRHYPSIRPVLEELFNSTENSDLKLSGLPVDEKEKDRKWKTAPVMPPSVPPPLVREGFSRVTSSKATDPNGPIEAELPLKYWEKRKAANQQHRLERFERVQALAAKGLKVSAIAEQLKMGPRTVKRFLKGLPVPPTYTVQYTKLTPYKTYLQRRFLEEGCDNARQLFREIRQQGYSGCASVVSSYITQLRPQAAGIDLSKKRKRTKPKPLREKTPSPRQVRWWFALSSTRLNEKQQQGLDLICKGEAELLKSYELAQAFREMLVNRKAQGLSEWLKTAQGCGVEEMKSLARGLSQDEAAVRAGINLRWSQGPVEGTINKLKLLKRSMYGRAGFELLRKRVLIA